MLQWQPSQRHPRGRALAFLPLLVWAPPGFPALIQEATLFPKMTGLGASFGSHWLEPEVGAGEGGKEGALLIMSVQNRRAIGNAMITCWGGGQRW